MERPVRVGFLRSAPAALVADGAERFYLARALGPRGRTVGAVFCGGLEMRLEALEGLLPPRGFMDPFLWKWEMAHLIMKEWNC